jgi:hypothetical protein
VKNPAGDECSIDASSSLVLKLRLTLVVDLEHEVKFAQKNVFETVAMKNECSGCLQTRQTRLIMGSLADEN